MKCSECVKDGRKSSVYGGNSCITTCMGVNNYWDENGDAHRHDPNSSVYSYRCSNGHAWHRTTYPKCRCGWSAE